MSLPESIEEWLSSQVAVARTRLAKAAAAAWTAAIPVLLLASGLSTANKMLGSVLWVSVTLNLFLLATVCWHRRETRRHEADHKAQLVRREIEDFSDISSDDSIMLKIVAVVGSQGHTTKGRIQAEVPEMSANDFEVYFHRAEGLGYFRQGGNPEFNAPRFVEILSGGREFIKRYEEAQQGATHNGP